MEQTLVLVHGIFDTGAIFSDMEHFFAQRGLRTHAPSLQPSSGAAGLEALALQLQGAIDAQIPVGQSFDLVGFSMGGLICRYYLQRLGGKERVRRFVAISVPQHGSLLAWLIPNRGCRQMRPGSRFLTELNHDLKDLAHLDILTLWTPFDLLIIPQTSSALPLGRTCSLPVWRHDLMVRDRRVLQTMAAFLLEESPSQPWAGRRAEGMDEDG